MLERRSPSPQESCPAGGHRGLYNTVMLRARRAAVQLLLGPLLACAAELGGIPGLPPLKGDLQKQYDAYIAATEARIQREVRSPAYLWSDESAERRLHIREGHTIVQPRNARADMQLGNGILHDWVGAVFAPGTTLARVTTFLQDYGSHKNYYRPEVIDSRLLGRHGETWTLRYRIVKRYLITIVFNTDQTANFYPLSSTRMITRSVATRIAEVKDAEQPTEHELDPRKESTIVWRLNTYWRLEEKDGGVYVECEAISLTRAAPLGLGWLVNPIIRSLPGASLAHLLEATRNGALGRH